MIPSFSGLLIFIFTAVLLMLNFQQSQILLLSPLLRNLWRCIVVLTRWFRTRMFTFVTGILVCKPVKLAKWLQMLSGSKYTSLHCYCGLLFSEMIAHERWVGWHCHTLHSLYRLGFLWHHILCIRCALCKLNSVIWALEWISSQITIKIHFLQQRMELKM